MSSSSQTFANCNSWYEKGRGRFSLTALKSGPPCRRGHVSKQPRCLTTTSRQPSITALQISNGGDLTSANSSSKTQATAVYALMLCNLAPGICTFFIAAGNGGNLLPPAFVMPIDFTS
eukprot:2564114-Ditylum_brightwellii.AAC.1